MTPTTRKIFISGAAGDAVVRWLSSRARQRGFDVAGEPGKEGRSTNEPLALSPVAAGIELGRAAGDARYEALADLDERLPPSRPLLTSCSAVPVDELASFTARPERVVGMSLFGVPRDDMLVELVPGLGTESRMVQQAAQVLGLLGLRAVILPPGSWPVYPRIIVMVINEAAAALGDGLATAEDIDTAMHLGANYPQGPLQLADAIGLDVVLMVLDALHAEYGDDRYRAAPLLRRLVHAGYIGKSARRGFYLYP